MSARRWLARGDWSTARHTDTDVVGGSLTLGSRGRGFARHGVAVLPAGRPDPVQVDSATADRWRRVVVRLAEPVPQQSWLRLWTRVEPGGAVPPTDPAPPDLASDLRDDAPADTPAGVWRAAALDALDARVLCLRDGDLWIAVELGGSGATTPVIADLRVETGDDGPVTALPDAYRGTGGPSAATGARPVDDGDGVLGRYLGLLGAQVEQTSSVIDELPALLSPSVAPDRDDSRWLETLATWVALDLTRLPQSDADRRENVTSAVDRHGRRGTRDGLVDQVRRETGLLIEVSEPILDAAVWRLDGTTGASTLGLTTGLVASDPGPPVLDRTAILDGSMLVEEREAGLPVHGTVAHRICVHVADSTPEQVAAVDAVVQRERPAHVLARTCTVSRRTTVPTQVGTDMLPPCGPPGLRNDTAYGTDVDGPGNRLGAVRLPAEPIKSSDQPADAPA